MRKRKPTSDEQFGSYDENDELPCDEVAEELGTTGYFTGYLPEEDDG